VGTIPFLHGNTQEQIIKTIEYAELYEDTVDDFFGEEEFYYIADSSGQKTKTLRLSRTDQIPQERLKAETASYLEGYIQALIDAN
jgi:hypothetical protein